MPNHRAMAYSLRYRTVGISVHGIPNALERLVIIAGIFFQMLLVNQLEVKEKLEYADFHSMNW